MTIAPILSWNNTQIKSHIDEILKLDGAKLLFGGVPLKNHTIPAVYGSYEPTAIFVPIHNFKNPENFKILTNELFGPF
jgi:1-pyrroline-5-carboxylate dehydrogenase